MGETFVLGNSAWRIEAIEPHRVVVGKAEGHPGVMPFWHGEAAPRSAELGEAVGALCRELAERLDDPELAPVARARVPARADGRADVPRNSSRRQQRLAGVVPTIGRS